MTFYRKYKVAQLKLITRGCGQIATRKFGEHVSVIKFEYKFIFLPIRWYEHIRHRRRDKPDLTLDAIIKNDMV